MVLISFSVEEMWCDLWSGVKPTSMRAWEKRPEKPYPHNINQKWMKVWEQFRDHPEIPVYLQHHWKARSKDRRYLFTSQLKNIQICELAYLTEGQFLRDGFRPTATQSAKEIAYWWFAKMYHTPERPMQTMDQIDAFAVFLIEWKPPSCLQCAYREFCEQYLKKHEMNAYSLKWPDGDYFCPGFSLVKDLPFPRFVDFKKIPEKVITLPYDYFCSQNCEKCKHLHSREPEIGVPYDERTNIWCEKDEKAFDYVPENCSILYMYLDAKIHDEQSMICHDFEAGTPQQECYDNDDQEEEEE